MLIVHYFQTTLYVFEIVRVLSTLCIIMHGMAVSIAYYFMHVCFACLCLCSDWSLFVCQVLWNGFKLQPLCWWFTSCSMLWPALGYPGMMRAPFWLVNSKPSKFASHVHYVSICVGDLNYETLLYFYIFLEKEWMMDAFYKGLSPSTQAGMLHFADPLVAALSSAGSLPISPVGCRFSHGTEEKLQGS